MQRGNPMSEVDGLFADLQQISSALNQELSAVNERIAALEHAISELKLGVTVWLVLSRRSDDYGHVYETLLGWAKDRHGWGLFLMDRADDESHDQRRLIDGSREERLTALQAVPAFLKKMKEEAARVLKEVQKATQSDAPVTVLQRKV